MAHPLTLQNPEGQHAPTDDQRAWDLAQRVIDLARGLIVSDNPFLSSSIGLLEPAPAALEDAFACNGRQLFVDASKLLRQFSRTREAPAHDLAHVLLHCLLLHPFVGASVDGEAWNLASDIVAESLVTEIAGPRAGERGNTIASVLKQLDQDLDDSLSTERLYRAFREGSYASARQQWAPLFHVDDHQLWPSSQTDERDGSRNAQGSSDATQDGTPPSLPQPAQPQEGPAQAQTDAAQESSSPHGNQSGADDGAGENSEQTRAGQPDTAEPLSPSELDRAEQAWSRAAKSMKVDLETLSRQRGSRLGRLKRELAVGAHKRIDYREFLRQFAVEHEDMRLSEDEFDYVFYTYGLELYDDMPLVEPLEYRNERRIRDFAIVIDTSSSVSAAVVQEFVNTTFDVLTSESSFFAKTNIHIIQADARVQSDVRISSLADLDRWRRTITLRGFGGTDFRPAFTYVQQLRQQGEFDDLQGLIYFTDGWGIYPKRMPPYRCAFVFYDEDHRPELVPPWAIQVVLHPGQFESMSVY